VKWAVLFVVAAALSAGCGGASAAKPLPPACGLKAGPPATYAHVIWIWMENHSFDDVIGNAKYLTQLAQGCGLATDYTAITHPSLPNYIAATSGDTQGITDDGGPSTHPLNVPSIFGQAASAASYEESMPSNCALGSSAKYAARHNPETYYTPVAAACATNDVPLGKNKRGAFASALANDTLPAFSFVTPNLCDDMHDCSVNKGDAWLRKWIPQIVAGPGYQSGNTAIFVVWDEDDGSQANQVPAIVVSPYTTPGTTNATAFTHYSLLRTTEELLGIGTYLGNAASAASMRSAFGL
jgi:phospholipase C